MDNQKLIYHPNRIASWLKGDPIVPIYVEISPTSFCNQACVFCGLDFITKKSMVNAKELISKFKPMKKLGIKSVMFAGEGEPLMHPNILALVKAAKASGLDVAMTTNGSLLTPKLGRALLPFLTWLRISFNGCYEAGYLKIHKQNHFNLVCDNIEQLMLAPNFHCTVGMQYLILPENQRPAELKAMCDLAVDLGVDYLSFKPFSQHPQMIKKDYINLKYKPGLLDYLTRLVQEYPNMNINYRERAFLACNEERMTKQCYALPFWSYIDSHGNIWACSVWIGKPGFYLGNVYRDEVDKIWGSRSLNRALVTTKCRVNCRMARCNEYLEGLKNGVLHENFI